MKASEIKVNEVYMARVSGSLTQVKVTGIRAIDKYAGTDWRTGQKKTRSRTVYDVVNLRTNRNLTFESAAKFRGHVAKPFDSYLRHATGSTVVCVKSHENLTVGKSYVVIDDDRLGVDVVGDDGFAMCASHDYFRLEKEPE